MSPHAAKARGIFDRATAPIGGHDSMSGDAAEGLLNHEGLVGNAKPDAKNGGLMPDLNMFDAPVSNTGPAVAGGEGTCDDDLTTVGWPPGPIVRATSTSSAGSAEAEESEV